MKKKYNTLKTIIGLFSVVLITGCSNNDNLSMTCTRTMEQNGIKTSLRYNVEYNDDYVTRIKTVETVETDNTDILDTYKEQFESSYSAYQNIDYYEYNIEINDNKLTSTLDVNYEKVDTDKLIEIDSNNSQIIKDGKINIDDIKTLYENLGATCKDD